jgi:hypothetical protein
LALGYSLKLKYIKIGELHMKIVIIGGNERMVCQYRDICKNHSCDAKVFVNETGAMKKKIGCPDLVILFTSTVSHRMIFGVVEEAKRNNIPIARVRSGSAHALNQTLLDYCGSQ